MPIRLRAIQFIDDVGKCILFERRRLFQELDRYVADATRSEAQKHSGREHHNQTRDDQLSDAGAKPYAKFRTDFNAHSTLPICAENER